MNRILRKEVLSLIGVVLVVGCGGLEPRDMGTLQEVDGVVIDPVDGQPYSGPVFRMRRDGSRITGSLKDGELDGPYEEYYENGPLRIKGTFKDGERDGSFELYYENGQLWVKETYKDGMYDGPHETYLDDNGQLLTKGIYKDGEMCGEWFFGGDTTTHDPC